MDQSLYNVSSSEDVISLLSSLLHSSNVLLVSGKVSSKSELAGRLRKEDWCRGLFNDFNSNPDYESVINGVEVFRHESCDTILAIGGGSAMDVAKCIKLFACMPEGTDYIRAEYTTSSIPLIVVPTTAGTGSEATRFAVIYEKGIKKSVTSESIIPNHVIFCPELLAGLPEYHRKANALDAFCHAIESMWSVRSTEESREYAEKASNLLLKHATGYIQGETSATEGMQEASYYAGKAIDISRTTAAHAMSYGITGTFGYAHGHAAALCLKVLWPYMYEHIDDCCDPRGKDYLRGIFDRLDNIYDTDTAKGHIYSHGYMWMNDFYEKLGLTIPDVPDNIVLDKLVNNVNVERLTNNPIKLSHETLRNLYRDVFKSSKKGTLHRESIVDN